MNRRFAIPFGVTAALVLLIVACSQESRDAFTPPAGAPAFVSDPANGMFDLSDRAKSSGTAIVTIVVAPHPQTSTRPMAVSPVSPGAQGASVQVSAQSAKPKTVYFPLNASQAYCSGGTTKTPLVCKLSLQVVASKDTFVVKILSSKTGVTLASGRMVQTVAKNGKTAINLTTFGVVRYVQIALGNAYPNPNGKSVKIPVVLTLADAWGYTIVGQYENSIALSDGDSSGDTSLSATTLTSSSQASNVTLNYNGSAMTPAQIGVSAGGFSDQTAFAPGSGGIVADPPLIHVAYGTTGVPVNLAGPGTVGPFSIRTSADVQGDVPCVNFAAVSGTGHEFLITATGNLGICWLGVKDKAGHNASIPVLVSAFAYASAPPSGAPSAPPTTRPTAKPTKIPPSPTPTPGIAPVIVSPNSETLCPRSGLHACKPYTAVVTIKQPGTPGTFVESDNCNPNVAILAAIDPGGQIVRYRVTAQTQLGSCAATFDGFAGKTGKLTIDVQASGIVIDTPPHVHHHHKERR